MASPSCLHLQPNAPLSALTLVLPAADGGAQIVPVDRSGGVSERAVDAAELAAMDIRPAPDLTLTISLSGDLIIERGPERMTAPKDLLAMAQAAHLAGGGRIILERASGEGFSLVRRGF